MRFTQRIGLLFKRKDKANNFVDIDIDRDGSRVVAGAASSAEDAYGFSLDFTNSTEIELIRNYRRISMFPIVAKGIEEIVNEAISIVEDEPAVTLMIDDIVDDKLIDKSQADAIYEAFEEVVDLLDFNRNAYDIFRSWYVDGRIAYLKLIDDKKPKNGIQKLRKLNVTQLQRVNVIEEDMQTGAVKLVNDFYLYYRKQPDESEGMNSFVTMTTSIFETALQEAMFQLSPDSVAYVQSGLVDEDSNIGYGYLHKAVRVANQQDLMETATIIYRLTRASSSRAVYVDTGNLPPAKQQAKVEQVKGKLRRDSKYDVLRGDIVTNNRVMAMTEDVFIGRSNGQRAAEISSLDTGLQSGGMDDVDYFNKKLYDALDVPASRFTDETSIFSRNSEITREELKFQKFITRLRAKFTDLLVDILKTQVVLKRIMTLEEFEAIEHSLKIKFSSDNFYAEMKEIELRQLRTEAAERLEKYVGIYYSDEYIRKKIIGQTTEEIEEQDKQIDAEEPLRRKRNEIRKEMEGIFDDEPKPLSQSFEDAPTTTASGIAGFDKPLSKKIRLRDFPKVKTNDELEDSEDDSEYESLLRTIRYED